MSTREDEFAESLALARTWLKKWRLSSWRLSYRKAEKALAELLSDRFWAGSDRGMGIIREQWDDENRRHRCDMAPPPRIHVVCHHPSSSDGDPMF